MKRYLRVTLDITIEGHPSLVQQMLDGENPVHEFEEAVMYSDSIYIDGILDVEDHGGDDAS